jgi:hypothetical protein
LIGRLDRAEVFAAAAHDDNAPRSEFGGLFGMEYAGTRRQDNAADAECESASRRHLQPHLGQRADRLIGSR